MESLFTPDERRYGLELQLPFSELLISGEKTIETRNYEIPSNLLYRHILIIESKKGKDGVSAVGSICRNETDDPDGNIRIIGSVVFGECIEYFTEEEWRRDADQHRVPIGSAYDWPTTRISSDQSYTSSKNAAQQAADAETAAITAAYQKKIRNGERVNAEDEEEYFDAIRRSRRMTKSQANASSTNYQDTKSVEDAATTIFRAATIAAGHRVPDAVSRTESSRVSSLNKRWGGALVEQHKSSERRYGWKVLSTFRAPCSAAIFPQLMRVHRSLFDCGSANIELPHY